MHSNPPSDVSQPREVPRLPVSAITQTLRFRSDPFALVAEARQECGDLFGLHLLGMGRLVAVASPRLLAELYEKDEDEVVAGEIRGRLLGHMVGDKASIGIDGEEYARRRRVTSPFFSGRKAFERVDTIRRETEASVARMPAGEPFAMQPYLDEISLRVTCRILYGRNDHPAIERLIRRSRGFLDSLKSPWVQIPALHWNLGRLTPWGRFLAAKRELFEALEEEILARAGGKVEVGPRQAGPRQAGDDVMSALLEEYGAGDRASLDVIVHELAAFVIGGAETTSKVMSWTLADVLAHPEAAGRIRDEIAAAVGDQPLGAGHLRQLPYLHAVLMEGIRTARAGPFAGFRWTLRDIELGDYAIPAETILAHCLTETGKSDVFPYPDRFEPANFFGRKVKMSDWMPFGGGARMCTGMGLAQLELAVVLGTLLRSLDLELCAPPQPVLAGIAFQPQDGLRVRIAPAHWVRAA